MAERQYGNSLSDIRSDHVERYNYAAEKVCGYVLDAACGCGYGSYVLALKRTGVKVLGVDIDSEAIEFARDNWTHERNSFSLLDLSKEEPTQLYAWLVCFETIEHLEDPKPFLKAAAKHCRNIVCSVPNQQVIPFDPKRFDFHYRHYTPEEIVTLLHECGFTVSRVQYQRGAYAEGFNDQNGRTIVLEGTSNVFSE